MKMFETQLNSLVGSVIGCINVCMEVGGIQVELKGLVGSFTSDVD